MRISDTLTGWLLLFFGIAVAAYAWTFPPAPGQSIGPGVFPRLIGGGLAVAGALLVRAGLKQHDGTARLVGVDGLLQPRLALRGALVIGALLFYALVVETAGFFITAFVFLGGLFLVFSVRLRWIPLLAAGVTVGLHVAFYTMLRVPLPWGWLEVFAW
jgi:putative tricarboxylic transport membrane protein